jgi:hypothetical protein
MRKKILKIYQYFLYNTRCFFIKALIYLKNIPIIYYIFSTHNKPRRRQNKLQRNHLNHYNPISHP